MHSHVVYILLCADGTYYVGSTTNLEVRLQQHQCRTYSGGYTATRLPVALKFSESFATGGEMMLRERQLKGWSHAKKRALIDGDWNELRRLSRRRSKR